MIYYIVKNTKKKEQKYENLQFAIKIAILQIKYNESEVRGMNLTVFLCNGKVFATCECVTGYSYVMAEPRDSSVHFDRTCTASDMQHLLPLKYVS